MNGATKTASTIKESNPLKTAQRALLCLFLIAIAFSIVQIFAGKRLPFTPGSLDSFALLLAFASTLVSLTGQLPAQNVLLAAVIIGLMGGAVHTLETLTGLPFGPVTYTQSSGPLLFQALPWFMPFLWVIVVLNARGVARLILRPWRKLRAYGYWLIGLTASLVLVFVLGLEPMATRVRHDWLWSPTKFPVDWFGAPITDFLGWVVATLLILGFSTPALMKKRPTKSYPEYHPLIVWGAIQLFFISGLVSQNLTLAAVFVVIGCLAIIPLAIRGARW